MCHVGHVVGWWLIILFVLKKASLHYGTYIYCNDDSIIIMAMIIWKCARESYALFYKYTRIEAYFMHVCWIVYDDYYNTEGVNPLVLCLMQSTQYCN